MNSPRERLRNKVKEKLTRDESVYSMARKGQNGGSMGSVGDRAVRKAFRHLMPVLILCYLAAYLDRTNVGFAALHMNRDLGLSAAAFGFGSGLFFLSYFFLEVPSNLLLARFGARRWIARILFTWGCISGAMAFISGEYSFYVLRFLLGAAEAGFFPGVLFFFTLWFPAAFRARAVAFLLFSAPVALSFGGPISGAILGLDGVFGIAGWRWMFFLEALPAVIMCFVVLRYLPDRPADAEWLAPNERDWLEGQIASEEKEQAVPEKGSLLSALANPSVLLLGYVNFTSILVTYGVSFFLPRIIKDFGLTDLKTGFVSSVPYALCAVALVWWGRRSDRKRERRFHTALPLLVAGVGLAAAALVTDPTAKVAGFSLAVIGSFSFSPPFWAFSFSNMSSKDAPASIAAINAIGNLGGFFGPWIMGFFRDYTGGYAAGLLILGTGAVVSAAIVLTMGRRAGKGISIERQSTTI